MVMLKYVHLLCNLPAPVTVQKETGPAAELYDDRRLKKFLWTKEICIVFIITSNANLDFKYTQNIAPTKLTPTEILAS